MANTDVNYLDFQIIAPDALDNSFSVSAPKGVGKLDEYTYILEVIIGTFQFRVGAPVGANSPTHTTGAKVILTATGGNTKIFYKAAAAIDQFVITY